MRVPSSLVDVTSDLHRISDLLRNASLPASPRHAGHAAPMPQEDYAELQMIASHSQRHARLSLSLAVRHESMVDLRHQVLGSLSWTPLALFCILCCALTSAKSHGGKIMHFLPHRWTWTKTLIGRITGAFCTDTFTSNRNCHPPTKHELAHFTRMSSAS